MIYSALIIEDNPVDAEVLRDYLHKYFPEINIVATGNSVRQIKQLLQDHAPQLVFMDIELTDGKSIELLDCLNTETIQLIFITSYDVFAIDAIRANAVDYIVKPVDAVVLKKAVAKALQRIEQKLYSPVAIVAPVQKISVPTTNGLAFIEVEKIIRAEANGSYTNLVLVGDTPLLVSRTLGLFEKTLPAHLFMRVHDTCVVNRNFIAGYTKSKTGSIKMNDGFVTNISAGKKDIFLKWMETAL